MPRAVADSTPMGPPRIESVIDTTLRRASGVHDLGGRTGFGPVPISDGADLGPGGTRPDSPFAAAWESKAFAVTQMAQSLAGFNTDAFRHGIEREDPDCYRSIGYWARWVRNAERMLVEGGVLAPDAVVARISGTAIAREARRTTDATPSVSRSSEADPATAPRFEVGRVVRVRRPRTDGGHTRLPGYVAGHRGTILARRGGWVFPDSHAHGHGTAPQWVYGVEFAASDLWPGAGDHHVHVDLFEPYLEPA